MAPITDSVEIARRPEVVFAYLDDLNAHAEWQEQLISAEKQGDAPTGVGTRCTETRRMGRREQTSSYEVSVHEPPRVLAFHGIDGPIRAVGRATVEPIGDGSSSRLSLALDFEGHGLGKLLLPLVRSQARKQVPRDQLWLKERLEQRSRVRLVRAA